MCALRLRLARLLVDVTIELSFHSILFFRTAEAAIKRLDPIWCQSLCNVHERSLNARPEVATQRPNLKQIQTANAKRQLKGPISATVQEDSNVVELITMQQPLRLSRADLGGRFLFCFVLLCFQCAARKRRCHRSFFRMISTGRKI